MTKINIIGAGRVGTTFLTLLGPQVQDLCSTKLTSAQKAIETANAGHATTLEGMREADIWLLTVPDTQIAQVARDLAERQRTPAIAVHFSGFHRADVMSTLKGWALGSVHPNLSFADPVVAARQFPGTPCGLEGDASALAVIRPLIEHIGGVCFPIQSERKALYHAGAVFSNNFATVLQAIARDAWAHAGVPDTIAAALNKSLLNATAENVEKHGPAAALTGPAARGDLDVVKAQGRAVADWDPALGDLYKTLSDMASDLKQTGKVSGR